MPLVDTEFEQEANAAVEDMYKASKLYDVYDYTKSKR